MKQAESFYRHMGVYGICVWDGKLLVVRKRLGPYTGKFDLPGGRPEQGESLVQTIRRELLEETGYSLNQLEHIGVCDFNIFWRKHSHAIEHVHHIAILYKVEILGDHSPVEIERFEEQDSDGAEWIPLEELSNPHASPLVLRAIEWLRTGKLPLEPGDADYS